MYARAVEETAERLRDLTWEAWGDFALAAALWTLAVATAGHTLQIPFLIAGAAGVCRGVRALWQRWELMDRVKLDRDAQSIPAVRRIAARSATMKRRQADAATIRIYLGTPEPIGTDRLARTRADLEALAVDLVNEELRLDPIAAMLCEELVTDQLESPLLNATLPADRLGSCIRRIRSGFEPRRRGAGVAPRPGPIIWATDGSGRSDAALPLATRLARGRTLIVLHLQKLSATTAGPRTVAVDQCLEEKIEAQADEARDEGVDVAVRVTRSHPGQAARAIADVARQTGAALIVVGSEPSVPIVGLLLGTVARRLLAVAPCPVLVVPANRQHDVAELAPTVTRRAA